MSKGGSEKESRPAKFPPEPLISLSEQELLEIALWIEIRGVEFFRQAADNVDDSYLRDFFLRLSGMEMEHEQKLRDRLKQKAKAGTREKDEELPPRQEYMNHLKTVSEKKVFPDTFNFLMTDLENFESPEEALGFAREIEDYNFQLYEFLRDFQVSDETKKLAELLAKEEMDHLDEINSIMAKMK